MPDFPQHVWNPLTGYCDRCYRSQEEEARSFVPISCMSDRDIEDTKKRVEKLLTRT